MAAKQTGWLLWIFGTKIDCQNTPPNPLLIEGEGLLRDFRCNFKSGRMNLGPDFLFVSSGVTPDGTVQSAQKNQSEHGELALENNNLSNSKGNANIQNFLNYANKI